MKAINLAIPKSSVWKLASILLVPLLLGFAIVYSMITTADTKYARDVEVKVLSSQLGFMTRTLGDLRESVKDMNSSLQVQLREIQNRQMEFYRQQKQDKSSSNNYGSRAGEANK